MTYKVMYKCEYCDKICSTKSNFTKHQKNASYCLKLQGKEKMVRCEFCDESFVVGTKMSNHKNKCIKSIPILLNRMNDLQNNVTKFECKVASLQEMNEQKDNVISDLQDKLENISIQSISQVCEMLKLNNKEKEETILKMTQKYVRKQNREEYKERYVIYLLTTESMQKDRRYIIGKAHNLTNRLSTYNKTDEHKVVYYQVCGDSSSMDLVENLVLSKLGNYREQANRERFILPNGKDVSHFIDEIKSCVKFVAG